MLHCVSPLPTVDSVPQEMGSACSIIPKTKNENFEEYIPILQITKDSDEYIGKLIFKNSKFKNGPFHLGAFFGSILDS